MENTIHRELQEYITTVTNGLITLKPVHLNRIIAIARQEKAYRAVLLKKEYIKGGFAEMRSAKISYAKAMQLIKTPDGTNGFYRIDVFDENNNCVKQIFTTNSHLF